VDFSLRRLGFCIAFGSATLPLALGGCHPGYSPNTYAANAAQQEAAVQRGMIIGVRQVTIAANGTVGAAAGGAAGGVAGSQVAGGPVVTALGAIGGTLVGGIGGTVAAQAVADTKGWEYIVQESGDRLVSVTQTSKQPLPVGLHVLVISDSQQARIVPDYTVQMATAAPPVAAAAKPAVAANGSAEVEMNIGPLPPAVPGAADLQVAPGPVDDPVAPAAAVPAGSTAAPVQAAPVPAAPGSPAVGSPASSGAATP
jgi:outer membrane lipoprotein SlyB